MDFLMLNCFGVPGMSPTCLYGLDLLITQKDLGIGLAPFIFGLLFIGQFACSNVCSFSKCFLCAFNKAQYQAVQNTEISDFFFF